jgi:hypothetical protein
MGESVEQQQRRYISRKRQTDRTRMRGEQDAYSFFFSSFYFSIDGKTAGKGKKKKFIPS